MKETDVATAAKLLSSGSHKYVDVRTESEFAESHAPGAINIPVMLFDASGAMVPNPAFLETVQSKLPNKSEPLLFGCKAGGRSAKAIGMLSDYTDTTNVTGGFGAWLAQGLPTEK